MTDERDPVDLYNHFTEAIHAGVVLSWENWQQMDADEQAAWLLARERDQLENLAAYAYSQGRVDVFAEILKAFDGGKFQRKFLSGLMAANEAQRQREEMAVAPG